MYSNLTISPADRGPAARLIVARRPTPGGPADRGPAHHQYMVTPSARSAATLPDKRYGNLPNSYISYSVFRLCRW